MGRSVRERQSAGLMARPQRPKRSRSLTRRNAVNQRGRLNGLIRRRCGQEPRSESDPARRIPASAIENGIGELVRPGGPHPFAA